jgi:uncharacterized membrane protein
MNKCVKKTILYRLLSIVTGLPIVYIFTGSIMDSFGIVFVVEVIVHSAIYYGLERKEEIKEREALIRRITEDAKK